MCNCLINVQNLKPKTMSAFKGNLKSPISLLKAEDVNLWQNTVEGYIKLLHRIIQLSQLTGGFVIWSHPKK